MLAGYTCIRNAEYWLLTGDDGEQGELLALSPFAGDNKMSKQKEKFSLLKPSHANNRLFSTSLDDSCNFQFLLNSNNNNFLLLGLNYSVTIHNF